jgi:glutamate synthase (NADPH/NADH) large chain
LWNGLQGKDYQALLAQRCLHLFNSEGQLSELNNDTRFNIDQQHTAYSLNQEALASA